MLRIAFDGGFFSSFRVSFRELQSAIFLKIDPPSVATRDRKADIDGDKILFDAGILSPPKFAANHGLDYVAEVDAGAKPAAPIGFGNPLSPASPSTAQPGALPVVDKPATESAAPKHTHRHFPKYP